MMRFIKEILYFLVSSVLVLALCEAFIRLTNLAQVSSTEFVDGLGRAKRENKDFVYFNEGFGVIDYNEHGFIGNSIELDKKENTRRIALIGDSFVESLQVFNRDYFGNLSEITLNNRNSDMEYEVLNMGRSGFVFPDMYIYQKVYAEKFNPDVILYFISKEDLIGKNDDPLLPKLLIDSLNQPVIDYNYNKGELRSFMKSKKIIQNLAFLNMTNIARKRFKSDYMGLLFGKFGQNTSKKSKEHEKGKLSNQEMAQLKGATQILNFLNPDKAIFINRDSISLPITFTRELEEKGFKYYDLGEVLKQRTSDVFDPNYWKVTSKRGHWNHRAHKILAEELTKIITEVSETK